jgi:replicative DNA helicase
MSGWERVSETVKEVKLIAGKHNIPIVLSYQFNKEGDVHLSDSIRQIATATMGVYIPQGRDDQRIIKIMDNRNGPTGEVTINWDFYRMNFVEVESIDDSGLNNFMEGE